MKKIATLVLALFVALTIGAGALAAEYPTTQSFIEALEENGLTYTYRGLDDDKTESVFVDVTLEDGPDLAFRYYFDPDLDLVEVRVFNFIDFRESALGDVLVDINQLNYDYRFVKFYADMTDISVTLSEDLIVRPDQDDLKEIFMDSLIYMYSIATHGWEVLSGYAK